MADDGKIDMHTAQETDAIVENTVSRAIPDNGSNSMENRLANHRRGVLRDVVREGVKKKIADGKLDELVNDLKPVLGKGFL